MILLSQSCPLLTEKKQQEVSSLRKDGDICRLISQVWSLLWKKKSLKKVKRRFVNWVDQEVTLHRAPFINDFRISFPLNATYSKRINSWIKFAMAKRVVNLEFDFEYGTTCRDHLGRYSDQSYSHYLLPSNVFTRSSCRYLTSICFKFVDLREEVLELLLSRCHSLERLHIERSNTLSNMRIINLGRKLKYLAIHECFSLREVEIHAVSLESFEFIDRDGRANVVCASVPSLVEARFCWQHYDLTYPCMLPNFLRSYCFPAQLSKLSLDIKLIKGGYIPIPSFPHVKYLELRVLVNLHTDLLPLMCFAEGCPLMHDFKLQLIWPDCCCPKMKSKLEEHRLETQKGTSTKLPSLRKFEWSGAFSVHDDLKYPLASYCVESAINLEKFICDPRNLASEFYNPKDNSEIVEGGRQRAKRLAMVIPRHIEFVIL